MHNPRLTSHHQNCLWTTDATDMVHASVYIILHVCAKQIVDVTKWTCSVLVHVFSWSQQTQVMTKVSVHCDATSKQQASDICDKYILADQGQNEVVHQYGRYAQLHLQLFALSVWLQEQSGCQWSGTPRHTHYSLMPQIHSAGMGVSSWNSINLKPPFFYFYFHSPCSEELVPFSHLILI